MEQSEALPLGSSQVIVVSAGLEICALTRLAEP
jgi:hypothetical protein